MRPGTPLAADGTFKIPGLRNVELTAPYFHNGGELTLLDVVNFYARGGNLGGADEPDPDARRHGHRGALGPQLQHDSPTRTP